MTIFELLILAVVLSMDAFAVAVCKGLALCKIKLKNCLWVGLWFGVFQALMPTIGYLCAVRFEKYVHAFSHWIAFVLLLLLGINMIKEALEEQESCSMSISIKEMFVLAIATSIDALAAGVTIATTTSGSEVVYGVVFIGITTFILSAIGVKIGSVFGTKYNRKAQITGGVVLILLGIKIVIERYWDSISALFS